MTPKEKGRELVNSFYQPLGYLKCGVNNTIMWEYAKQCALVQVDGMYDIAAENNNVQQINYLVDVKNEIEKL
jgi:hypothetical protein